MPEQPGQSKPSRPTPEPHPYPRAALPPKAEDCPDTGTYRDSWWQSGFGMSWSAAGIAIAIILGLVLLRTVIGPMLSPATP